MGCEETLSYVDEIIDSTLARPMMHGAHDPHTLEILILQALSIRYHLCRDPGAKLLGVQSIYSRWSHEYFGTMSAVVSSSRLCAKFGWSIKESCRDHPDTWPKIIDFYKELVRRERESAPKVRDNETDNT